jgi:hypothetical protein
VWYVLGVATPAPPPSPPNRSRFKIINMLYDSVMASSETSVYMIFTGIYKVLGFARPG